jgi:hypothetical protein
MNNIPQQCSPPNYFYFFLATFLLAAGAVRAALLSSARPSGNYVRQFIKSDGK